MHGIDIQSLQNNQVYIQKKLLNYIVQIDKKRDRHAI